MAIDFDNPNRGRRECPRCKFTTEPLRSVRNLNANEGYVLGGAGDDANTFFIWAFFGWTAAALQRLWIEVIVPVSSKSRGEARKSKYDKILKDFPNSQICPNCKHILRLR